MRIRFAVLGLAATAVLGACALNINDHSGMPEAFDPQPLVAARQGGMAMSVSALGAVSSGLQQKAPARSYRLAARGLADFARSLPALFDPRSAGAAGAQVKPALWSDPAGWAARTAQYRDATAALLAAVDSGDEAGITAALASTKAACKACHDAYRLD